MTEKEQRKAFMAKASAVSKKISYQFPDGAIGKLAHAILDRAIQDACGFIRGTGKEIDQDTGLRYLKGDMYWCELAGVDSDWVRRVLKESGILEGKL